MIKRFLVVCVFFLLVVSSIGSLSISSKLSEKETFVENYGYDRYLYPEYFDCYNASEITSYGLISSYECNDFIDIESEKINISKDTTKPLNNQPMNSPWPMRCFDARHTGRSPYNTVNTWGEIWRVEFNSLKMLGSPAIDNNGTIYCSSQGDFFAVNPNGTLKWTYEGMSGYPWCTPAIDENNIIYFGTIYGFPESLYALNPDGSLKWKINGDHIRGSPAIGSDGTIYYADAYNYNLRAATPNGTIKWTFHANHHIYSDIAIGLDGTLYFGTIENGKVYAVYPNGTLKWSYNTGTWVHGSASIGDDGTIYIGSDRKFYAFYPGNGTLKWQIELGAIWCTPVIDNNGIIYVGSDNGKMYALYPNGTIKWAFPTGGHFWFGTSPALSAEGTIYFGTTSFGGGSGNFFALYPNGEEKWRFTEGYYETSPAIGENGIVYMTSCYDGDGALLAFGIVELKANANGPYYGLINHPVHFKGSASGGYSPYTSWHWSFGDGNSSDDQNPLHTYSEAGNYTVTLTVTDNSSNSSSDISWTKVQATNEPPEKPIIDGVKIGGTHQDYDYTFVSTDPEDNSIFYYIDWDDNTNSGWLGPYDSGHQITLTHTWNEAKIYYIKAKTKDIFDAESGWSTFGVIIPRNRASYYDSLFLRFLERFPILQKILSFSLLN